MKKLTPIFEQHFPQNPSPWLTVGGSYFQEYLRISFEDFHEVPEQFFGSFVESLMAFCDYEMNETFLNDFFKEDCIALGGGLRITDNEKVINPECCSDFASWKEWQAILDDKNSDIWMGHDPMPTLEYIGDSLRVWSDNAKIETTDELFHIDFTHDELSQAFEGAKKQLKLVAEYVPIWAEKYVKVELQKLFISAFQHYLTLKD